jgi:hypothetical protein
MKSAVKKIHFYTFVLVLTLLFLVINPSLLAGSNSDFYYYSSGHKVALPLSTEFVAVKFKQDTSLEQQRAVVESQQNVSLFSERKDLPIFNLTILPMHAQQAQLYVWQE